MDNRDATMAATLLAEADLFFKNRPPIHGGDAIEAFYGAVFAAGADRTAHLISNVEIRTDDATVAYKCRYQRALIDSTGLPKLVGIGF